jgi:hypothetical protein
VQSAGNHHLTLSSEFRRPIILLILQAGEDIAAREPLSALTQKIVY